MSDTFGEVTAHACNVLNKDYLDRDIQQEKRPSSAASSLSKQSPSASSPEKSSEGSDAPPPRAGVRRECGPTRVIEWNTFLQGLAERIDACGGDIMHYITASRLISLNELNTALNHCPPNHTCAVLRQLRKMLTEQQKAGRTMHFDISREDEVAKLRLIDAAIISIHKCAPFTQKCMKVFKENGVKLVFDLCTYNHGELRLQWSDNDTDDVAEMPPPMPPPHSPSVVTANGQSTRSQRARLMPRARAAAHNAPLPVHHRESSPLHVPPASDR
jgi:hypothetical protein